MKYSRLFLIAVLLAVFCSCQKKETEAERKAEIERQVQERLAAEHQAQDQTALVDRVAALEAQKTAADEPNVAGNRPNDSDEDQARGGGDNVDNSRSGGDQDDIYSTFSDRLQPYGVWLDTEMYGYVW